MRPRCAARAEWLRPFRGARLRHWQFVDKAMSAPGVARAPARLASLRGGSPGHHILPGSQVAMPGTNHSSTSAATISTK